MAEQEKLAIGRFYRDEVVKIIKEEMRSSDEQLNAERNDEIERKLKDPEYCVICDSIAENVEENLCPEHYKYYKEKMQMNNNSLGTCPVCGGKLIDQVYELSLSVMDLGTQFEGYKCENCKLRLSSMFLKSAKEVKDNQRKKTKVRCLW